MKYSSSFRIKLEKLCGNVPTFNSLLSGPIYLVTGSHKYILEPKIVKKYNDGYSNSDLMEDFPNIKFDIFSDTVVDDIMNFIDDFDNKIYQKFGK
jgi:hypothetical protein